MSENPGSDRKGGRSGRKKRLGEVVREQSLFAAPTIIIVYPLFGFALGYLAFYYLHWPIWVSLITTVLGVIQAIREVYILSRKVYGDDDGPFPG